MLKKSNPLIKFIVIPIVVLVAGIVLLSLFSGSSKKQSLNIYRKKASNDNATGDTPVETLKTLTSEMTKVEEQNRKLIAENKDLKNKNQNEWQQWKNDLLSKVKQKLNDQNNSSDQAISKLQKDLGQKLQGIKISGSNSGDLIIDTNDGKDHQFVWIGDLSQSNIAGKNKSLINDAASILNPAVKSEDQNEEQNEDQNEDEDQSQNQNKEKSKTPYYTIPKNTILTGAVALQPLIGRIPIDGKVEDPYKFKAVLGQDSIAANNTKIPAEIAGIIVSGTATGDLLGQCARGAIDSMTFIFPDGRINTVTAENGAHLGEIAGIHGEQCIKGKFHSNALEYLGGTAGLSFMQGYANALSQAQTVNSYTPGAGGAAISTIIKNGNKYAIGQGASQAAESAIRWWNQRVQNSFDYVEVSNVNVRTKDLLKLNIIINQEIKIDYDKTGRKVVYENYCKNNENNENNKNNKNNKKNIFAKLD